MAIATTASLIDQLGRLQLLEPTQLDELARDLRPRFTEGRALAQELTRRGWLTSYQAGALLQGRELLLGPYLLLDKLGEGATGVVYKARHQAMRRTVAVKLIRKELVTDAEVVARFYREIEVVSKLSHPNVVHAYDAGPIGPTHFLAMEYVEGIDLTRLVETHGPLPLAQACDFIAQAALGLQHAHEQGLVHRDIKPSNLMVMRAEGNKSRVDGHQSPGSRCEVLTPAMLGTGLLKVLDLGLARFQRATDSRGLAPLTQDGKGMMGTPDYMAPEQALDLHSADARADVYSLGCTLFYLLTGKPPFVGNSLAEKLMKHQQAEPPALEKACPEVPIAIAAAARRMLAKEPAERLQTAAEVAAALGTSTPMKQRTAIRGTLPSSAPAAASLAAGDRTLARQPRRGLPKWVMIAAACLLLGAGLAALLLLGNRSRHPAPVVLAPTSRTDGAGATTPIERPYLVHLQPDVPPLAPGSPLSYPTLVLAPQPVTGAVSWTLETRAPRSSVIMLASSPDGRWLAAAGKDGVIRLSERGQVRPSRLLVGGTLGDLLVLAWSPDSHYLATFGALDLQVRIWEADSGRSVRLLTLPGYCHSLAWSPDGKTVAAGSRNGETCLYDVVSGQRTRTIKDAKNRLHGLAWSPDGLVLAGCSRDKSLYRWDMKTGAALVPPVEHPEGVIALAWSPDGATAATFCMDGKVRLWPRAGSEPTHVLDGPSYKYPHSFQVAWSPDGKMLAVGSGHDLRLWTASGKVLKNLSCVAGSVAWMPDSKSLVVGGLDRDMRGTLQPIDASAGTVLPGGVGGYPLPQPKLAPAWSPDGKILACPDYPTNQVSLWDVAAGQWLVNLSQKPHGPVALAWSADGKFLATGSGASEVFLWDIARPKPLHSIKLNRQSVTSLAWSPDGKTVAAGTSDKYIQLIDTEAGKNSGTIRGPKDAVTSLAWSPDGKILASGSVKDSQVRLWDPAGKPLRTVPTGGVYDFAWSADSKLMGVASGPDQAPSLAVWDAQLLMRLHHVGLKKHGRAVAWAPGDSLAVLFTADDAAQRWDLKENKLTRRGDRVGYAVSSPDGRLLAGVSSGEMRLWEAESGRPLGTLVQLRDEQWLIVASNGHYRASSRVKEDELVYVIQTSQGQETLSLGQFAQRFGWKNDPDKVRLTPR